MNQTLKQYGAARRKAMYDDLIAAGEYMSYRELEEVYSDQDLAQQWISEVYKAAREGAVLSRYVLDGLYTIRDTLLFRLMHDYPGSIPEGYLTPRAREANKKSDTFMAVV